MFSDRFITLNEFIIEDIKNYPGASGRLGALLRDIAFAAKRIHLVVNKAGLVNELLGATGQLNIQGEKVQHLDKFSNEVILQTLRSSLECAGVCSEEEEEAIIFDNDYNKNAKYVVHIDPLDGSGNIGVSGALGSIFGIYERRSPVGTEAVLSDFLQKGSDLVAAGYVLYGSSSILVYAAKRGGANGFTLDGSIGEFYLSHPRICIPEQGSVLSLNMGYYRTYPPEIQRYLEDILQKNQPLSYRYIGTMVADMHRTLIQGGLFLYPPTLSQKKGKMRLLYECKPMAFIVEKAGGASINHQGQSLLSLIPEALHERTAFYSGSRKMIDFLKQYL